MAESSWPSPSNSRVVDDAQYEKIGISLGPAAAVYGDFTNPQLVYGDSTGLQIKVAADRYAVVRGHAWWSGSSIFTKAIASNSSGSTRIDLVVLRLSRTTWDVTVQIVQGTPGAGAPSSTKDLGTTGVYELVLAQVSVANNASTITAANVTYVATHVGSDGGLRVPNTSSNALAYVPQPYPGMRVCVDATADVYMRNAANNGWVIIAQAGMTAYVPTLTAATTNPVLGTGGVAEAEYAVFNGKMCNYRGTFKFGSSGINVGSGQYLISLPFQANASLTAGSNAVGSFLARDSSGPTYTAGSTFINSAETRASFIIGSGGLVAHNAPFAWAINDSLTWEITYAIA